MLGRCRTALMAKPGRAHAPRVRRLTRDGPRRAQHGPTMFFFFSNKLGWLGSIAVSIVLTLLLVGLVALF